MAVNRDKRGGTMTALYAILAIICIGGILMGAYLIGFDDGVTAEQM